MAAFAIYSEPGNELRHFLTLAMANLTENADLYDSIHRTFMCIRINLNTPPVKNYSQPKGNIVRNAQMSQSGGLG